MYNEYYQVRNSTSNNIQQKYVRDIFACFFLELRTFQELFKELKYIFKCRNKLSWQINMNGICSFLPKLISCSDKTGHLALRTMNECFLRWRTFIGRCRSLLPADDTVRSIQCWANNASSAGWSLPHEGRDVSAGFQHNNRVHIQIVHPRPVTFSFANMLSTLGSLSGIECVSHSANVRADVSVSMHHYLY